MEENCIHISKELPVAFGSFTKQENWDYFFTLKGVDDFSEWYADWPQLRTLLRNNLSFPPPPEELNILVPACGNSRLSENLYDDGFRNIINVDYSKVVISAMMKRNLRGRPAMKWRVMDITNIQVEHKNHIEARFLIPNFCTLVKGHKVLRFDDISHESMEAGLALMEDYRCTRTHSEEIAALFIYHQFENGTFDAIVDKGGLDALMESELDSRSGILYISEVKRLLKAGGKYICLTLAEPHVLGLLFRKFRFGWKVNLYAIAQEPSSGTTKKHTFMLVAEKYILTVVSQVQKVFEALERENTVRAEYSNGADIWYSLEDLKHGVKGDIREIEPGRAVNLFLGEPGVSRFFYTGVLLDAERGLAPFSDRFRVVVFRKAQTCQKMLAIELPKWFLIGTLKASRLLMIVLDSSHSNVTWDDIVKGISCFVKQLTPVETGYEINHVASTCEDDLVDGVKQRNIVHEVKTALSGTIYVEDVMLHMHPPKHVIFRRFCFERTESWVHSEVLLSTQGPNETSGQVEDKKGPAAFRTRKKGKPKKIDSHSSGSHTSSGQPKFERKVTVRGYHQGLIAGLMLFSVHSKRTTSAGGLVKTVIIGLGSGTLPMFMRSCLPTLRIEVVELDPVVLNVASEYFGFIEDERLKVHITDATKFVKEKANSEEEGNNSFKVDLLIIDVDSSDSSSGLISPEADFVEESFFLAVKDSLSDKGLFIFKLVSKFPSVKGAVYSKLKRVFSNVYHFYVDKDFVEIIFALKRDDPIIAENELAEACDALARSVEHNSQGWAKRALHNSKLIKPLP